MAEENIPKTVLTMLFELFQFWQLSFRLRNAAQTFQHLIDNVLRELLMF